MTTTTTITSRALHRLCQAARSVACGQCDAPAGQPCLASRGQQGYHLARFGHARTMRLISADGMAAAIMAAGPVFTPVSIVTGGAS